MRRLIVCAAIIGCSGAAALFAAERATFVLVDGERKSGIVVFHGGERENLINGYLNLGTDDGKEITIRADQVALIQFAGGTPPVDELQALPADGSNVLVRKNGDRVTGRFLNIIGGDTVKWQGSRGDQQMIPVVDVARIYLNSDSARRTFDVAGRSPSSPTPSPAVGVPVPVPGGDRRAGGGGDQRGDQRADPRGAQGGSQRDQPQGGNQRDQRSDQRGDRRGQADQSGSGIRVEATQAWVDSGVVVRSGDVVSFRASGQINFGKANTQTAGPDGNPAVTSRDYPVPSMPAGGLVGRVGTGTPFPIGTNMQPMRMTATGPLLLGINDNELVDNSGFFTVVITKR